MKNKLAKYRKLKRKMVKIDMVIPGFVRKIYQPCGQASCRCKKSKRYYHGPYYLWGRKIKGRLSSKSISKERVKTYRQWIENRKKLKKIFGEMLKLGCTYATKYKM